MKRMNIREFRQALALNQEPIVEVVKFHRTVGYFVTPEEWATYQKKEHKKRARE